jgi:hypothetical protein
MNLADKADINGLIKKHWSDLITNLSSPEHYPYCDAVQDIEPTRFDD